MKIETKLNIDKKAYFLKDNKVAFTTISDINIRIAKLITPDSKPLIQILYTGTTTPGIGTGNEMHDGVDIKDMPENLLFTSKKELLASL